MNIAIYSRKSKFTGKGESIENQVELCREHALRQWGEQCHFLIYEDEGFSAKNTDRPMFQKMMQDIRSQKIQSLICYRLDRISRSVSDFSTILDELERYHVSFISIRESFDTSSPIGRAMIYIASVFAQLERETIAERVKDNRNKLAYTGRWQGGSVPLGYQTKKIETIDEDGKKHSYFTLTEDESSSQFIRDLFRQYLEFGSLAKLERYYCTQGICFPSGSEVSKGVLGQYLRNPTYATNTEAAYDYLSSVEAKISHPRSEFDGKHGLLSYNRTKSYSKDSKRRRLPENEWTIAVSNHKGLVDGDIWANVQIMMKENRDKYPRWQSSNVSLFSGFLRCASCGAPMKIQNQKISKKGIKNFYYVCTRKQKSKGILCNQQNIPGIPYDQALIQEIRKILQKKDGIQTYINRSKSKLSQQKRTIKEKIQELEIKISTNDTTIKNLILKLADSSESNVDNYIRQTIDELGQKNKQLKLQMVELSFQVSDSKVQELNLEIEKEAIRDFLDCFDDKNFEQKKIVLKNLIKEIHASKEQSKVELQFESLSYII